MISLLCEDNLMQQIINKSIAIRNGMPTNKNVRSNSNSLAKVNTQNITTKKGSSVLPVELTSKITASAARRNQPNSSSMPVKFGMSKLKITNRKSI